LPQLVGALLVASALEAWADCRPHRVATDEMQNVDCSNAEEAQDGQTKPDYIAKMAISIIDFARSLSPQP
jgi:hypothetical protein